MKDSVKLLVFVRTSKQQQKKQKQMSESRKYLQVLIHRLTSKLQHVRICHLSSSYAITIKGSISPELLLTAASWLSSVCDSVTCTDLELEEF